ncbi:MAG: hypothetical protein ABI747_03330 [Candidatus Moraniibacteriota bacterium]
MSKIPSCDGCRHGPRHSTRCAVHIGSGENDLKKLCEPANSGAVKLSDREFQGEPPPRHPGDEHPGLREKSRTSEEDARKFLKSHTGEFVEFIKDKGVVAMARFLKGEGIRNGKGKKK